MRVTNLFAFWLIIVGLHAAPSYFQKLTTCEKDGVNSIVCTQLFKCEDRSTDLDSEEGEVVFGNNCVLLALPNTTEANCNITDLALQGYTNCQTEYFERTIYFCFETPEYDIANVCGGHGKCVSTDSCECDSDFYGFPLYMGEECSIFAAYIPSYLFNNFFKELMIVLVVGIIFAIVITGIVICYYCFYFKKIDKLVKELEEKRGERHEIVENFIFVEEFLTKLPFVINSIQTNFRGEGKSDANRENFYLKLITKAEKLRRNIGKYERYFFETTTDELDLVSVLINLIYKIRKVFFSIVEREILLKIAIKVLKGKEFEGMFDDIKEVEKSVESCSSCLRSFKVLEDERVINSTNLYNQLAFSKLKPKQKETFKNLFMKGHEEELDCKDCSQNIRMYNVNDLLKRLFFDRINDIHCRRHQLKKMSFAFEDIFCLKCIEKTIPDFKNVKAFQGIFKDKEVFEQKKQEMEEKFMKHFKKRNEKIVKVAGSAFKRILLRGKHSANKIVRSFKIIFVLRYVFIDIWNLTKSICCCCCKKRGEYAQLKDEEEIDETKYLIILEEIVNNAKRKLDTKVNNYREIVQQECEASVENFLLHIRKNEDSDVYFKCMDFMQKLKDNFFEIDTPSLLLVQFLDILELIIKREENNVEKVILPMLRCLHIISQICLYHQRNHGILINASDKEKMTGYLEEFGSKFAEDLFIQYEINCIQECFKLIGDTSSLLEEIVGGMKLCDYSEILSLTIKKIKGVTEKSTWWFIWSWYKAFFCLELEYKLNMFHGFSSRPFDQKFYRNEKVFFMILERLKDICIYTYNEHHLLIKAYLSLLREKQNVLGRELKQKSARKGMPPITMIQNIEEKKDVEVKDTHGKKEKKDVEKQPLLENDKKKKKKDVEEELQEIDLEKEIKNEDIKLKSLNKNEEIVVIDDSEKKRPNSMELTRTVAISDKVLISISNKVETIFYPLTPLMKVKENRIRNLFVKETEVTEPLTLLFIEKLICIERKFKESDKGDYLKGYNAYLLAVFNDKWNEMQTMIRTRKSEFLLRKAIESVAQIFKEVDQKVVDWLPIKKYFEEEFYLNSLSCFRECLCKGKEEEFKENILGYIENAVKNQKRFFTYEKYIKNIIAHVRFLELDIYLQKQPLTKFKQIEVMEIMKLKREETEIVDLYSKIVDDESSHMLFIGVGGSGKSCLFRHFAFYVSENYSKYFPIFVKCDLLIEKISVLWKSFHIDKKIKLLGECIILSNFSTLQYQFSPPELVELKIEIKEILKSQKLILIVDGFDEVPDIKKNSFTNLLKELMDENDQDIDIKKVLLSSRPISGKFQVLDDFNKYFIQNLTPDASKALVSRILKDGDFEEKTIIKRFEKTTKKIAIDGNPLMSVLILKRLLDTEKDDDKNIVNKYHLYELILNSSIDQDKRRRKIAEQSAANCSTLWIMNILSIMGYIFHRTGDNRKSSVISVLSQYIEEFVDTEKWLFNIQNPLESVITSLVKFSSLCSSLKEFVVFSHRTIQEFFASRFLINPKNNKNLTKLLCSFNDNPNLFFSFYFDDQILKDTDDNFKEDLDEYSDDESDEDEGEDEEKQKEEEKKKLEEMRRKKKQSQEKKRSNWLYVNEFFNLYYLFPYDSLENLFFYKELAIFLVNRIEYFDQRDYFNFNFRIVVEKTNQVKGELAEMQKMQDQLTDPSKISMKHVRRMKKIINIFERLLTIEESVAEGDEGQFMKDILKAKHPYESDEAFDIIIKLYDFFHYSKYYELHFPRPMSLRNFLKYHYKKKVNELFGEESKSSTYISFVLKELKSIDEENNESARIKIFRRIHKLVYMETKNQICKLYEKKFQKVLSKIVMSIGTLAKQDIFNFWLIYLSFTQYDFKKVEGFFLDHGYFVKSSDFFGVTKTKFKCNGRFDVLKFNPTKKTMFTMDNLKFNHLEKYNIIRTEDILERKGGSGKNIKIMNRFPKILYLYNNKFGFPEKVIVNDIKNNLVKEREEPLLLLTENDVSIFRDHLYVFENFVFAICVKKPKDIKLNTLNEVHKFEKNDIDGVVKNNFYLYDGIREFYFTFLRKKDKIFKMIKFEKLKSRKNCFYFFHKQLFLVEDCYIILFKKFDKELNVENLQKYLQQEDYYNHFNLISKLYQTNYENLIIIRDYLENFVLFNYKEKDVLYSFKINEVFNKIDFQFYFYDNLLFIKYFDQTELMSTVLKIDFKNFPENQLKDKEIITITNSMMERQVYHSFLFFIDTQTSNFNTLKKHINIFEKVVANVERKKLLKKQQLVFDKLLDFLNTKKKDDDSNSKNLKSEAVKYDSDIFGKLLPEGKNYGHDESIFKLRYSDACGIRFEFIENPNKEGELNYVLFKKMKKVSINGEEQLYDLMTRDGKRVYSGPLKNGRFHGKNGTIFDVKTVKDEQVIYEGGFQDGKFHSTEGFLYHPNGKKKYTGGFANGKFQGFGKLFDKNEVEIYSGNFQDGKFHGQGKLFTAKGILYDGFFRNGLYHADMGRKGILYSEETSVQLYEGGWKEGQRSGFGKQRDPKTSNIVYVGEWLNDRKHGFGEIHDPKNGKTIGETKFVQDGVFEEGDKELRKVYYFEGGAKPTKLKFHFKSDPDDNGLQKGEEYSLNEKVIYKGFFKNGVYHKEGELFNEKEESIYKGGFFQGKYNGFGTLKCDKYIYKGGFSIGKFNGKGVKTSIDTNTIMYDGDFINGLYDGKGVLFDKDGKKVFDGIFEDGIYDKEGICYTSNGDVIFNGKFVDGKMKFVEDPSDIDSKKIVLKDLDHNQYAYLKRTKRMFYCESKELYNPVIATKTKLIISNYQYRLNKRMKLEHYNIIKQKKENKFYFGETQDKKKHGKGEIHNLRSGKPIYYGGLRYGLYHGRGLKFSEVTGNLLYKGWFCEGHYQGRGKLYNEEKRLVYEGIFLKSKYHGMGVLYDLSKPGKIPLQSGEFYDGQFLGKKPNTYVSPDKKTYLKIKGSKWDFFEKIPVEGKYYRIKVKVEKSEMPNQTYIGVVGSKIEATRFVDSANTTFGDNMNPNPVFLKKSPKGYPVEGDEYEFVIDQDEDKITIFNNDMFYGICKKRPSEFTQPLSLGIFLKRAKSKIIVVEKTDKKKEVFRYQIHDNIQFEVDSIDAGTFDIRGKSIEKTYDMRYSKFKIPITNVYQRFKIKIEKSSKDHPGSIFLGVIDNLITEKTLQDAIGLTWESGMPRNEDVVKVSKDGDPVEGSIYEFIVDQTEDVVKVFKDKKKYGVHTTLPSMLNKKKGGALFMGIFMYSPKNRVQIMEVSTSEKDLFDEIKYDIPKEQLKYVNIMNEDKTFEKKSDAPSGWNTLIKFPCTDRPYISFKFQVETTLKRDLSGLFIGLIGANHNEKSYWDSASTAFRKGGIPFNSEYAKKSQNGYPTQGSIFEFVVDKNDDELTLLKDDLFYGKSTKKPSTFTKPQFLGIFLYYPKNRVTLLGISTQKKEIKMPKVFQRGKIRHIVGPQEKERLKVGDNSFEKIGGSGWNLLVRLPINQDYLVFKIKVEKTNNDKSGLFIGVIGNDHTSRSYWESASTAFNTGGIPTNQDIVPISPNGYPVAGSTYEFVVDQGNDEISIFKDNVFYGKSTKKPSKFSKPLALGLFLYYAGNKVSVLGISTEKKEIKIVEKGALDYKINDNEKPNLKVSGKSFEKIGSSGWNCTIMIPITKLYTIFRLRVNDTKLNDLSGIFLGVIGGNHGSNNYWQAASTAFGGGIPKDNKIVQYSPSGYPTKNLYEFRVDQEKDEILVFRDGKFYGRNTRIPSSFQKPLKMALFLYYPGNKVTVESISHDRHYEIRSSLLQSKPSSFYEYIVHESQTKNVEIFNYNKITKTNSTPNGWNTLVKIPVKSRYFRVTFKIDTTNSQDNSGLFMGLIGDDTKCNNYSSSANTKFGTLEVPVNLKFKNLSPSGYPIQSSLYEFVVDQDRDILEIYCNTQFYGRHYKKPSSFRKPLHIGVFLYYKLNSVSIVDVSDQKKVSQTTGTYEIDPSLEANLEVKNDDTTFVKKGQTGWNCLVKLPVKSQVHTYKLKVDKTNTRDLSGLFLGLIGSNHKQNNYWDSASTAWSGGCPKNETVAKISTSGHPIQGSTYEFKIDQEKDQVVIKKDGVDYGISTRKPSTFQKPLYMGLFLYYPENSVTIVSQETKKEKEKEYIIDNAEKQYVEVKGHTFKRIGLSGWKCLIKFPIDTDLEKYKVKIDKTNKDKSGLFVGVCGSNHKSISIFDMASTVFRNGGIPVNDKFIGERPKGYPIAGDTFEFTIDKKKDTITVHKEGVLYGVSTKKVSSFVKPIFFGISMYYPDNQVSLLKREKEKAKSDIIYEINPSEKNHLLAIGKSFKKIGPNGWNCMVKLKITGKYQRFKIKVNKTNLSDYSGLFLGVIGSKLKSSDIWKSASTAWDGGCPKNEKVALLSPSGYPLQDSIYEFRVDTEADEIVIYKDNILYGKSVKKPSSFSKPLFMALFLYYRDNTVTVEEISYEKILVDYICPPLQKPLLKLNGKTFERIGTTGWKLLVRLPIVQKYQRFKLKVDKTNNDKSGLFLGVVGNNHRESDIWKSASTAFSGGVTKTDELAKINISGYPMSGNVYEFVVDQVKDQIMIFCNGKLYGMNSRKPSSFEQPIAMGMFLYYPQNTVTVQEVTFEKKVLSKAKSSIPYDIEQNQIQNLLVENKSFSKLGVSGWNLLVRIPVKSVYQRFKLKIDKTNLSDLSGLFIGLLGSKIFANDIWKSASTSWSGGGMPKSLDTELVGKTPNGYPLQGCVYEFVVDQEKDVLTVYRDDVLYGVSVRKPSSFSKPLAMGIFLYYVGNKVTVMEISNEKRKE